jgi:hypothetical protein
LSRDFSNFSRVDHFFLEIEFRNFQLLMRWDGKLAIILICAWAHFNLCFTQSVIPCRSDEEEAQITEFPLPVTPTKPLGNEGASHDYSDAERAVTEFDEAEGTSCGKEEEVRAFDI